MDVSDLLNSGVAQGDLSGAGPALLSVNNYHYPRGGADAMYLAHGAAFETLGWRHAWFSMKHPRNRPTPWSEYFPEEIEFGHAYSPVERIGKAAASIWSIQAQQRLKALVRQFKPDVAHLHNIYHHLSPSILATLREAGIPTVMTAHDFKIACPNYRMYTQGQVCERCRGGNVANALVHRCVRDSVLASALVSVEALVHRSLRSWHRGPDLIVAPSQFVIDKMVSWGFDARRFVLIRNPVDATRIAPQPAPGKDFVYIGRLSVEKGLDCLIEAVRRSGVSLTVAGEGPLGDLMSQAVAASQGRIRWLGRLEADRVQELLRSARAVVVPSQWYENAPLSVLEAFAAAKPVIATQMGGLPEMVTHGKTGWLVPVAQPDALAGMLAAVQSLPDDQVSEVGRAAREFALTEHGWDRYLARMRALYQTLGLAA
jgi:glycosyltransferase involved in cell wall biosynthesis